MIKTIVKHFIINYIQLTNYLIQFDKKIAIQIEVMF